MTTNPNAQGFRQPYKLSKEDSSIIRSRLIMAQQANSSTVTRLLYKAGILRRSDVNQAQLIAEHLHKSLDEIVLTSAFLDRRHRPEACKAAQSVERGLVAEELAVAGLANAIGNNLTFEQGLNQHMGWGH